MPAVNNDVITVKAGIQLIYRTSDLFSGTAGIPAFAGMTESNKNDVDFTLELLLVNEYLILSTDAHSPLQGHQLMGTAQFAF